ncbi:response regulator [Candidatus Falkowbacteria bacterium CG_4_10_14_0_2_um_filter_48_10]|uniref:Response regulator n=1 Tax=Candidatus Falkowbacteria bacterium CG23_combo_of_CG06-09_8_20_14_all_49_15 TaxID=1974572 RepID=A0A2G9ZKC6_9BACT|nr:MAG: response regulator [Candidatus Falkowbacteria bacterium CG23_combo_of_CG06-09_8_20_14_all_49_15]PJA09087.1 MAG: response regulator [Candidatus Falkowbacteria bacterium CG_4_10_14_0_2_um_filter_48_10]
MANKKILLVEDDPFLLNMYASKLELNGFTVLAADDGLKAYELARKEAPQLILLDVLLPKMNGFEVLHKLKLEPATAAVPVIILTNLGQAGEIEQGQKLGAVDYLVKAHFTPAEVMAKIQKYLAE